jgi:hypothetical protein
MYLKLCCESRLFDVACWKQTSLHNTDPDEKKLQEAHAAQTASRERGYDHQMALREAATTRFLCSNCEGAPDDHVRVSEDGNHQSCMVLGLPIHT